MICLGKGIFTWDGFERRSLRYGSFGLSDHNYKSTVSFPVEWSHDKATSLASKKVRLFAHILEARNSAHVGDLSLSILPTRPDVGEIIEIGIGTFIPGEGINLVTLQPSDDRSEFWIDPRILYRLHDQTVEIFAEETDADEHPRAPLDISEGVRACGDGAVQVSGRKYLSGFTLRPDIVPMGDGLFMVREPDLTYARKGDLIPQAVPVNDRADDPDGI